MASGRQNKLTAMRAQASGAKAATPAPQSSTSSSSSSSSASASSSSSASLSSSSSSPPQPQPEQQQRPPPPSGESKGEAQVVGVDASGETLEQYVQKWLVVVRQQGALELELAYYKGILESGAPPPALDVVRGLMQKNVPVEAALAMLREASAAASASSSSSSSSSSAKPGYGARGYISQEVAAVMHAAMATCGLSEGVALDLADEVMQAIRSKVRGYSEEILLSTAAARRQVADPDRIAEFATVATRDLKAIARKRKEAPILLTAAQAAAKQQAELLIGPTAKGLPVWAERVLVAAAQAPQARLQHVDAAAKELVDSFGGFPRKRRAKEEMPLQKAEEQKIAAAYASDPAVGEVALHTWHRLRRQTADMNAELAKCRRVMRETGLEAFMVRRLRAEPKHKMTHEGVQLTLEEEKKEYKISASNLVVALTYEVKNRQLCATEEECNALAAEIAISITKQCEVTTPASIKYAPVKPPAEPKRAAKTRRLDGPPANFLAAALRSATGAKTIARYESLQATQAAHAAHAAAAAAAQTAQAAQAAAAHQADGPSTMDLHT